MTNCAIQEFIDAQDIDKLVPPPHIRSNTLGKRHAFQCSYTVILLPLYSTVQSSPEYQSIFSVKQSMHNHCKSALRELSIGTSKKSHTPSVSSRLNM